MSYENKYKESKKSADFLYEKKFYNAAVNRYYYCIYQMIMEYNRLNKLNYNDSEKEGTHEKTIDTFLNNYFDENYEQSEFNKYDMEARIYSLKDQRKAADYTTSNIIQAKCNEINNNFNKLYGDIHKILLL